MDGGGAPPALEKNAAELTVMDVYDIASAVGQEFERVIDQHGCEAIARLMPKVVRVLEILEVLVSRNHINPEMEELRLELDRLRLERMDRIEKERKHQKVRAGAGGSRRGRATAAGRGENGAPAPPLSPPRSPQPLGKTKREAVVRGRGAAGGTHVGERPGQAHGLCVDAALASLRVWVCCCFFPSLLEVSFLLSFLHPFPGHCVSFPLCLHDWDSCSIPSPDEKIAQRPARPGKVTGNNTLFSPEL